MAESTPIVRNPPSGRHTSRRPRKLYVFTVLALAAFLLIVSLRRKPSDQFEATAVLYCVSDGQGQTVDPGQLRDWLTDARSLQNAIDHVHLSAPDEATHLDPPDVAKALGLERKPTHGPSSSAFRVFFTGHNSVAAVAMVNRICNQFVHQKTLAHEEAADSAARGVYTAAARRRQEVENELRRAENQLNVFLETSFARLREVPVQSTKSQEPPDQRPGVQANSPELTELTTRLETLTRQRAASLERMTLQHPRVVELTGQITALQSQIANVRRQTEDLAPITEPLDAEQTGKEESDRDGLNRESLAAEHSDLKQAVQHARQSLIVAREEELGHWKSLQKKPVLPSWHVDPAVAARPLPRRVPPSLILMATVMGMTASGSLLLAFGRSPTIGCVADAESALSLPVLGTVTVPGLARHETNGQAPTAQRVLLFGGEAVLLVFILTMVLAAVLDGNFAEQLRGNPLAALTDGVRHLLQATWS